MALEVRLLGKLEVLRDGCAVLLPPSKKTRALLGYLAATNRPHRRDHLCDLFWDGPDDPRAALRWSLSKIRSLTEGESAPFVKADHDQASFDSSAAGVDLLTLKTLFASNPATASTEMLKQATALIRGELLDGLDLPDCYRYHEWWISERESTRALRIAILSTLAGRLADAPDAALVYARSRLLIDPFSEDAHIDVIQLLGRSGHLREALQQYESCRRMLEGQLGAKPSAALERARSALGLAPTAVVDKPDVLPPPRSTVPQYPFVGRAAERRQIAEAVAAATTGQSQAILWITGEPGIGKTRLLEEVSVQVRSVKGVVLKGRAYEAEMVRPYGPWIDALRSTDIRLTDLSLNDRNHLFDAVARLVADLAKGGLVGLILDDVQWFDEASVALLHFVARALSGSRLLIACAARSAELNDNAAVASLVRGLRRDGHIHHVQVDRLDARSIEELIHGIDSHLDVARVFAESEGNPLFAIEIAQGLARDDGLSSDTIEGLIGDRLEQIEERAYGVVPWAAAFGRSFNPEIIRVASGLSPAELVAALKELESRGVIRPSLASSAEYDFTHDLIRRAAYHQLSAPRRRVVHLQLARALSSVPDPDAMFAGEIAHHAALGGDDELAVQASVKAGDRSLRVFAYVEAYSLADRVLQRVTSLPASMRIHFRMELLRIAAHASVALPDARNLDSEISHSIAEAKQAGQTAEVATGLYLLSFLHHHDGNYAAAHDFTLREAEAGRAGDATTAARALGNTGRCLALIERDMSKAESILNEAQTIAAEAGIVLMDVPWGLGLVRAFTGDYNEAVDLLQKAHALAQREQDHWAECECLKRLALIELERGDPARARKHARELGTVAAKIGEGSEAPFAATLEALGDMMLGDANAPEKVEQTIEILRRVDAKALLSRALTFAAVADLKARDLDRAAARAAEALAAAEIVGRRAEIVIARAILARVAKISGDAVTAAQQTQLLEHELREPHAIAAHARRTVGAIANLS